MPHVQAENVKSHKENTRKHAEITARQTLAMSGVACSTAQGKLVTLKELRENLRLSIEEARQAQKDGRWAGRVLAAAKAAQATSNVILEVFGAFDKRVEVIGKLSKLGQAAAKGEVYDIATASMEFAKLSNEAETAKDALKKRADIVN
ncbi:hypothetical protein [Rhizobium laguerreae]|uniref:hypothetical protein n=1 Tax=Rhizobium laguerreae TaxID=1076926 RepID=UPI001C900038|nr:hypothetical protein [Rhizobium laguerreae]MBY3348006.1 hypothetical protein [Rhizobium laguerreae]MBY3354969.1 hypothetical protein [Rhizobium laguerreae]MBY3376274.1 hypothetical protein [Rhizobium laguerreae]MBY3431273.1 hypothetical protein [Rhizobium laguerreae]MBY3439888.1 hypothetical protein [Rhizobium laguerreae]